jgi:hypothetical protein
MMKIKKEVARMMNSYVIGSVDCQDECMICCMEFEDQEPVAVPACGHYYHKECIDQWIQKKQGF